MTPSGHPITRNPARIEMAVEMIRDGATWAEIIQEIKTKFSVSRRSAERDFVAAKYLIGQSVGDRLAEVGHELVRMERVADKAERAGDFRAAVSASHEKSKLLGLHAPTRHKVEHVAQPALELRQVIGVLDEAGRAALEIVLGQIEAAKASGQLALAAGADVDEDVDDAEIVEGN